MGSGMVMRDELLKTMRAECLRLAKENKRLLDGLTFHEKRAHDLEVLNNKLRMHINEYAPGTLPPELK